MAEDGGHLDPIQAISGNDHIKVLASPDFDGAITGVKAHLETVACLAQGEHCSCREPQDASGIPWTGRWTFAISIIQPPPKLHPKAQTARA